MRKTSKKGGLKGFVLCGRLQNARTQNILNNCPRTPEGGQSVKTTFLMRKTSKKGAKKFCFIWTFAKRPYTTYS